MNDDKILNEYAFDITLAAALRVKACSEADARAVLAEVMDCADSNFGAWRNGDPILAEASLRGVPHLYEVNGETVEHVAPAAPDPVYFCLDCGWTGHKHNLEGLFRIRHIDDRVSAGELIPAGSCPKCRALIEVDDADVPANTLEQVATIMRQRGWSVTAPGQTAPESGDDTRVTAIRLLTESLSAWEGEEDSVKEEHAALIAKLTAFLALPS